MHVETIGAATRTSEIQTGQCFFFQWEKQPTFAITTEDEHGHKAAIVFSRERSERCPWIAVWNSLPQTALLINGDVRIRTEPSSLQFGNDLPFGPVISAGGQLYVAAALQRIDFVTVNLHSGLTESIPATGLIVSFSRWTLGIAEGPRWIPIFEFPLPEEQGVGG
jgi:hypothetical protein